MAGEQWYGQIGGQTEPRWEIQMAGGVEWSALVWTVRWADGSALGSTDYECGGVEWSAMVWTVRWADGAALETTDGEWSGEERRGEDS